MTIATGNGCTRRPCWSLVVAVLTVLFPAITEAGSVTLAWDRNQDGTTAGYRVYFGTESGRYTSYVDVGSATSAVVNTPDSGVTYYFAVLAYSRSGETSPLSAEVSWNPTVQSPSLISPGSMTNTVGQTVALQLSATDPAGLRLNYAAAGLPPGLSITPAGLISGIPTTAGAYSVSVAVTNTAGLWAIQSFTWSILR